MSKYFLAITFFYSVYASADWVKISNSRIGSLDDLYILDKDHFYTPYYFSVDGAATWTEHIAPVEPLSRGRAVEFLNTQIGYVGQLHSQYGLFKTTDGGKSFLPVVELMGAAICGISHIGENFVAAVGPYHGIAEDSAKRVNISNDGGQTWFHPQVADIMGGATDVHFIDELHGIVSGSFVDGNGAIFYTENGGKNWRLVAKSPQFGYGWKINFLDDKVGFVTLFPSHLGKTKDGGRSWELIELPIEAHGAEGIGFFNEDIGFISSSGSTMITRDGGKTWVKTNLHGGVDRYFLFDGKMYAGGNDIYVWQEDVKAAESSREENKLTHQIKNDFIYIDVVINEPTRLYFDFFKFNNKTERNVSSPLNNGSYQFVYRIPKNAKTLFIRSDVKHWILDL